MSALQCTRCYAEFLLCPILLSPLNNPMTWVLIMPVLQMGTLKPSKVGHMTIVIQMRSGDSNSGPSDPKPVLDILSHPKEKLLKRLHHSNSQC